MVRYSDGLANVRPQRHGVLDLRIFGRERKQATISLASSRTIHIFALQYSVRTQRQCTGDPY